MPRTTIKAGARAPRLDHPLDAFDDEGVCLAILAALQTVYELFPHITVPQYLTALEVWKAEPYQLLSLPTTGEHLGRYFFS